MNVWRSMGLGLLAVWMFVSAAVGQELRLGLADAQNDIVWLYLPRVAVAPDGSYALAAEALIRTGAGREVLHVIVQRYSPGGNPVGPTHLFAGESCSGLDLWLTDFMQYPEIAFQPGGMLVLLMQHTGEFQIGNDGVRSSEMTLAAIDQNGQIVDLNNSSSCVQRKLIFPGGSRQDRPRLEVTPAGDILITGDGFFNQANLRNVAIRILDAAGNEVVEQVIPHSDPQSTQSFHMHPDIASNGQLALSTWHECPVIDNQGNANTCDIGAQFATVSGQGLSAVGTNVMVNAGDPPGTLQLYPTAAMNASGSSVIVWADARDGAHGEIYGQRFNASGGAVGGNFKVSAGQGVIDSRPEAAVLDNGRFMVVWSDSLSGRYTARGREYDAAGNPLGPPFELAPGAGQSGDAHVAPDGNSFAFIYLSLGGGASVPNIGSNKGLTNTAAEEFSSPRASSITIDAIYPNPFSESARIRWSTDEAARVEIRVFDVMGREVARVDDRIVPAGSYESLVNAATLPVGVYFVEMRTNGRRIVERLVRAH